MYVFIHAVSFPDSQGGMGSGNETGFESTLVHRMLVFRSSRLVMTKGAERC